MEPITIGLGIITLIGIAANITKEVVEGQAKEEALKFQIGQANQNADILDKVAGDSLARGSATALLPLLKGGQIVGEQKAAAGASGFDVASRSSVNLYASSKAMARHDSDLILNNAMREAFGYSQKAAEYRWAASEMERTKQAVPVSTMLGTVGAIGSGTQSALNLFPPKAY